MRANAAAKEVFRFGRFGGPEVLALCDLSDPASR
jgi:hypothetical protein